MTSLVVPVAPLRVLHMYYIYSAYEWTREVFSIKSVRSTEKKNLNFFLTQTHLRQTKGPECQM